MSGHASFQSNAEVASPVCPRHVERLTPPGRGAIAVVRIEFHKARDARLIDQYFRAVSGLSADDFPINRILFGTWEDEDVVVVRTADCVWEVQCHGGQAAVSRILSQLTPDECETSSEHSAATNLLSDTNALLLQAKTAKTASHILTQQQGLVRDKIQSFTECSTPQALAEQIADFLSWQPLCEHLIKPWTIAVAGRPNVGKSSLLNRLIGFHRVIVFDQPGTTRDSIAAVTCIDGWPFQLIDTAGIRKSTDDSVEAMGVEAARSTVRQADACVFVADASAGWTDADDELYHSLPTTAPTAIIMNKIDLPEASPSGPPKAETQAVLQSSATKDIGIETILDWVKETLIPHEPALTQPLPVTAHIAHACTNIRKAAERRADINDLRAQLNFFLSSYFL